MNEKKILSEEKRPYVLLLNGSPHSKGTTKRALEELAGALSEQEITTEIVDVGQLNVRGCMACGACKNTGKCVIDDIVNELSEKFLLADGVVLGSPVYYSSPNGGFISLLDRLFYSGKFDKTMKVGASVVVARRGGLTASFDVLNKYFYISGMPIASSYYWNQVHGNNAGEAEGDLEGLDTMRSLGKNMAFLIKAIRLAGETMEVPKRPKKVYTNFIR